MATAYPFDPTGTSTANRIVNEQHVLTAQNFRDYQYVIPKFAPFVERNFSIKLKLPNNTIRPLVLGVDYYFSNQFIDASKACAKPIFSSVSFLDTDTFGILTFDYNTIGGIWTLSTDEISRILSEEMRNPRITAWEQVTNIPVRFPVIDHEWDLIDMKGASHVVDAIDGVRDALLQTGDAVITGHIADTNNPHGTTKAQIGLSNVQNYAIANQLQAQAGTSGVLYMTPLRVAEAISVLGGALINAHTANASNPHNTTKAQVGLGSVLNYGVATQLQAEDGTSNALYMTPLRVAQAITAQTSTAISHVADKQNPHDTTKEQVGLSNIQNYAVATQADALAGTATDKYMTPLRTRQLVVQYVTSELDGHASRTDNPHSTTAAQVGLSNVLNYPIASTAEAQTGLANNRYMTPLLTKQAVDQYVAVALDVHTANADNPHQTTKVHVGLGNVSNYSVASTAEAQAGTAADRYMTPANTAVAINSQVGSAYGIHAGNTSNPHNTTKAQVGLGNVQNYAIASTVESQAGLINTSYMTPVRVREAITAQIGTALTDHAGDTSNPHNTTAGQVGLGNVRNYGIATQLESQEGSVDTSYMTPLRTKEAINSQVISVLTAHTDNANNPHQTTKAQVGLDVVENYPVATLAEAQTGTVANRYMTPLRTQQFTAGYVTTVLSQHTNRIDNPHVVTKAQVGLSKVEDYAIATLAEAQAATSLITYMTPQRTRESIAALASPIAHATATNNPHSTTAAQVGAHTKAEITALLNSYVAKTDTWVAGGTKADFIAEVLSGESANSAALGGMSLAMLLKETAGATQMTSYDVVNTTDPVTTPFRWIELGTVAAPTNAQLGDASAIATNHPDAFWFMTGGHKQEATAIANAAASSSGYLIHAKNGGDPARHAFDITRLTGTVNSDVGFGYTVDVNGLMHVWLKVACGFNGISVTHMAELASTLTLTDRSIVQEPVGISYVTPISYATSSDVTALTSRITALEQTVNSVTVV